jgi:hypothetical protein
MQSFSSRKFAQGQTFVKSEVRPVLELELLEFEFEPESDPEELVLELMLDPELLHYLHLFPSQ